MKKRILFISQVYPHPSDSGGKIKTLNTLRALATEYVVSAVFVSDTNPPMEALQAIEKLGIDVKIFYSKKISSGVRDDLAGLIRHYVRGTPHYVFRYAHEQAFLYIQKQIKDFRPHIIHIDHIGMTQYLPKEKKQIWILDHHNVETHVFWTRFLYTQKITRKLYMLLETVFSFMYEYRSLRLFDCVLAMSNEEARRVKNIFHNPRVVAQPLIYREHHIKHISVKNPYILFIGYLKWPPNEDAVDWFLRDMFPFILQKLPNAEFHIVGERDPRYEKNWAKTKRVFLHGYQKNLNPYLARAHVFVLPFRMGGGLRLKAITALFSGVPIVSTPLGVEGLLLQHGKNCLIARSPKEFYGSVVELLSDPNKRKTFVRESRIFSEKYMNSVKTTREFLFLYRQCIL